MRSLRFIVLAVCAALSNAIFLGDCVGQNCGTTCNRAVVCFPPVTYRCNPVAACAVTPETTVRIPLCPRLASLSYGDVKSGEGKLVSSFAIEQAKRYNVRIFPISSFEAELVGQKANVDSFLAIYPSILCGFNSSLVIDDEAVFTTCMAEASKWIKDVGEGRAKNLMQAPSNFCGVCCLAQDASAGSVRLRPLVESETSVAK